MPLTRKQAWRRVRVRRELGYFKDEAGARGNRVSRDVAPPIPRRPSTPLWYRRAPNQPPSCSVRDERSPTARGEINPAQQDAALGNLRAPKHERDPPARLGASAARRQAGAAFVRVGSRVSFNTVVAAILIPSAKDLHDTARQELWWQETDYRDFRINFIQFMRSPPTLADGPEMVPVDIVAESSGASVAEEKQKETVEDDLQPVVMGAVEYGNAPPDQRAEVKEPCVRAWAVEETEEGIEDGSAAAGRTREGTSETRLSAAAAAAANVTATSGAAAESAIADDADHEDTPSNAASPLSNAEKPLVTAAVPEAGTTPDMDSSASSVLSSSVPPLCASDKSTVVEDNDDDDTTDEGACWEDEQERSARSEPCLSWDSTDCEDERDRDNVRIGRSLSDLETVRRSSGTRLHGGISGSFTAAAAAAAAAVEAVTTLGKGCDQGRPRALSLDGWFTCGLQSGIETKSYETYDHAGRLRDLVKLPPVPTICVTSSATKEGGELDLTAALQRFRLAIKPGVEDIEGRGGASTLANGMEEGKGKLEKKCASREGVDGMVDSSDSSLARKKIPSLSGAAARFGDVRTSVA